MSNEAGSAPVDPEPGKPPVVDRDLLAQALEREAARVFEYCRALVGREDAAMSVTEAALNSARSMLAEPDRLRAWLADLARRQAGAAEGGDATAARPGPPAEPATDPAPDQAPDQGLLLPDSREVVELVYRHGIHSEDLGAVLGVPADEASALLAAAELELGRPEPPAEPDPAEALPEVADPISAHSMLPDPDRLRAWLFALARQEAAAAIARGTPGPAAPGTELTTYTRNYPARTDAEHTFPPATWWQGSAAQPTSRRRLRIAALTAIPLAAAIAVAVYLGGASRPVSARTDSTAGSSAGSGDLPRSARPNAGLAAVAPRASASPNPPISVLLPVSATPLPQPTLPPPAPSPTPKPTPKPSTKPSPTPTPKPSASPSPSPKPSATTTPKSSATPKPSTTVKASATPTATKSA